MKSLKVLNMVLMAALVSGCATSFEEPHGYQGEFTQVAIVGGATPGMNKAQMAEAIDRAYLDGVLTAEQARKAHLQLEVKGHQTAEEIAVINRNRLAKRDQYETRKESLDVIRDVGQTGSSIVSDINDIKNTIRAIGGIR